MATLHQLETIERDFRELILTRGVLPAPDRVEYGDDEVTFFWDEQRLAVVVEADGGA